MTLQEILVALLRRWKLIVFGAVFTGVVALGMSFAQPPTYEATSTLAIAKATVSVNFDKRLTTMSEEQQAYLLRRTQDLEARRKALTALVPNAWIAQRVIEQLGDKLPEELRQPNKLVKMVEGESQGDAIAVHVRTGDPVVAAAIANAWAREYEKHINSIYGTTTGGETLSTVQAEAKRANQDYLKAQTALEEFLADNRLNEINRQIEEKKAIVSSLLQGKKDAIEAVVNAEIEARSEIVSTYIRAQLKNLILPFQKEQEDRIARLAQDYTLRLQLEELLESARALRSQVSAGNSKTAAATTGLPLLLMKIQAFASTMKLPTDLQINFETLSQFSTNPQEQKKDLDALVAALEQQIEKLSGSIAVRSQALMENRGYQFLNADIARQPQMQAQMTDEETVLARVTQEVSKQLLQLQGLEEIPNYTAAAAPIAQAIVKLEDEIDALEAELEAEQAKKKELMRARDLAWEKYDTLATKVAEVDVASSIIGSEVRFASPALAPTSPVSPKKKQNALLGLFAGLILAMGLVLIIEHPAVKGLMKAKRSKDKTESEAKRTRADK